MSVQENPLNEHPHATLRKAQRGISQEAVEITMEFGDMQHQTDGRLLYFMTRKACRRASRKLGKDCHDLQGTGVVVRGDTVLTYLSAHEARAYHRARTTRQNYRRFARKLRVQHRLQCYHHLETEVPSSI